MLLYSPQKPLGEACRAGAHLAVCRCHAPSLLHDLKLVDAANTPGDNRTGHSHPSKGRHSTDKQSSKSKHEIDAVVNTTHRCLIRMKALRPQSHALLGSLKLLHFAECRIVDKMVFVE